MASAPVATHYNRRSDAIATLTADAPHGRKDYQGLTPLELPLSSADLSPHAHKRADDDSQTSCSATPSSSSQELSPHQEGALRRRRRRRAGSALHPCPPSPFAAAAVQMQVVPPEPVREGQAAAAAPVTPANLPPSPVASSYQDARSVCSTAANPGVFDRPSATGRGSSRRFVHSASNNAMVCTPASAVFPALGASTTQSSYVAFGGASGRELMEHLNSLTAQARLRQQREAELARGGGSGRAREGGRPEIVPEPATVGAGGYGPVGSGAPRGRTGGQQRRSGGWLRRVFACGGVGAL